MAARRKTETVTVNVVADDGMLAKQEIDSCGHVDMHYTGPEILSCELPKGHNGDHQCKYPGGVNYWNNGASKRV